MQKIVASRDVCLVCTKDKTGRDCYFFIRGTDRGIEKLKNISSCNDWSILDYGIVIESGFGLLPSIGRAENISKKHGFDAVYLVKKHTKYHN